MDNTQTHARISPRPYWELVRAIAIWRYNMLGEIPWYAVEATDVTTMKGVKAYYI